MKNGFLHLCVSFLLVLRPSQIINNYFQMIVEEVASHGGVVLKFAGDAIIAEWKVVQQEDPASESSSAPAGSVHQTDASAVFLAAQCAAKIVRKCSDYPVDVDGQVFSTLNVHCGVGFGNVVGLHVGDKDRKEYLILGEPIRQVADALDASGQGEVYASQQVLKLMGHSADIDESVVVQAAGGTPQMIASGSEQYFQPKEGREVALPTKTQQASNSLVLDRCKDWSLESLELLHKQVSCYVHPAVLLANGSSPSPRAPQRRESMVRLNGGRDKMNDQSQAELRDVFTAFIQPQVDFDLTAPEISFEAIECLNSIMMIVQSEVSRFKGQVRQFIVDDKGLVVIANFGLRGSTFPNM